MLFYPGQLSMAIAVAMFFIIITLTGLLIGGWYLYEKRIASLKSELAQCEQVSSNVTRDRELLEHNIDVIKRNCRRKLKPVIVDDELKVDNLFNAPPR